MTIVQVLFISNLGLHFVPRGPPVAATASNAAIERGLPHFMTLHGTLHAFCTPLSCLHSQLELSQLHFNPTDLKDYCISGSESDSADFALESYNLSYTLLA